MQLGKRTEAAEVTRGVTAFLAFALMCGCSSQQLYKAGQEYQREQCRNGPPAEYEQCMERANESYDTYQRHKKEVEDDPKAL